MKKSLITIVLLSAIALMLALYLTKDPFESKQFHETTIKFDHTELDLGNLKQGKPQPGTFTLTNTGDTPFVELNPAMAGQLGIVQKTA